MIIIEKNEGTKIPYEVTGNVICFDGVLSIDMEAEQDMDPVHIDVCADAEGTLVIGTQNGIRYVAELDIPKKEYLEPDAPEGEDEEPAPPVVAPLDLDKVKLTLWAIE